MIDTSKLISFSEDNVWVDWDNACNEAHKWQIDLNFRRKSLIQIVAEYGVKAHEYVYPPDDTNLLIIVWPPHTFFFPTMKTDASTLDGVIIGDPCQLTFTHPMIPTYTIRKTSNIRDYSNIDAIADANDFFSAMIQKHNSYRMEKTND